MAFTEQGVAMLSGVLNSKKDRFHGKRKTIEIWRQEMKRKLLDDLFPI